MDVDNDRNYDGTSVSQSDKKSEDKSNSHGTPEPTLSEQRSLNMLQGCRSVDEIECFNRIDEGIYGVFCRSKDKTGEIIALKKVKMEKEQEGFPLTSLREINILLPLHQLSIVDFKEVVVGSSLDSIFVVMKYLHDNWVLHRDMKHSNLLLNNRGELKISDFGLARQALKLLLGAKQYSTAIGMLSLGYIIAEIYAKNLSSMKKQKLIKSTRILGTPNETIWQGFFKLPGVKVSFVKYQYHNLRKKFQNATAFMGLPVLSDTALDTLYKLLTYDPEKRITVDAALNHEWFREVPLSKFNEFMPTFPVQHA
ncbi:Cyclin-dependent kinase G-1 [Capsicum chinense]|nr:Cyclin-dependent kinase G-1 [Capsicum chinense]